MDAESKLISGLLCHVGEKLRGKHLCKKCPYRKEGAEKCHGNLAFDALSYIFANEYADRKPLRIYSHRENGQGKHGNSSRLQKLQLLFPFHPKNKTMGRERAQEEVKRKNMSIILDTNRIPYDTLMPDKVVTDFLEFCRNVKSRYEGNAEEIGAREAELGDLEHYMELHSDLDCKGGYALYKKMRETRRERRKCKNEMELLRPMYDWLEQNGDALNRLTIALGDTRRKAEVIDSRKYMSRTDVLEG